MGVQEYNQYIRGGISQIQGGYSRPPIKYKIIKHLYIYIKTSKNQLFSIFFSCDLSTIYNLFFLKKKVNEFPE